MNANEIAQKTNSRLQRLQKIIRVVRALLILSIIGVACIFLEFLASAVFGVHLPHGLGIVLSPHTLYRPPFNKIPPTVIFLGIVRAGLFFAGAFTLNQLFRSYSSGAFFTIQNISYLKRIGCLVMCDWLVTKLLDWIATKILFIGFAELTLGVLVVLIAWIMDEGRKIQEEQELTV